MNEPKVGRDRQPPIMKNFVSWISVVTIMSMTAGMSIMAGCVGGEARYPRWEANRQAILNGPPPPVPMDEQTIASENAYRACLVRAARYIDAGSADVAGLASLIAPMCYPQFSAFEAAADAGFSDRDRWVFDHAGDQRQIDLASDAVRTERTQAALSGGAGASRTQP
jgi:hypothetical protein